MATVLFSLPVHESNETIRDTIDNARRFNGPDHPIMIHVNRSWEGFDTSIAELPNVHVNPKRWHTQHAHSQVPTHVTNFQRAVELGLTFTHMAILHTSELFVREGMSNHIAPYDHSLWFTPDTQPVDPSWPPMHQLRVAMPGLLHYLGNLQEGSWWSRALFAEIARISAVDNRLSDFVSSVALEEAWFPTISWWLTAGQNYSHPYCAFKHDEHFLSDTGFVDDIRAGRPITFWQPHNFVYDYAPFPSQGLYSVKRIARDLADPMRSYIRNYS
jgi:hypothetical protein